MKVRWSRLRLYAIVVFSCWCGVAGILWLHAAGHINLLRRAQLIRADEIVEFGSLSRPIYSYALRGPAAGSSQEAGAGGVVLLENARPLAAAGSPQDVADATSGAAYYLLGDQILFSATGHSDARTNGSQYQVEYSPWRKTRHKKQYLIWLLAGLGLAGLSTLNATWIGAAAMGRAGMAAASSVREALHFSRSGFDVRQRAPARLILAVIVVAATFLALLIPSTVKLGFTGDDWNLIFTRMSGDLIPDFMASARFFLHSQRPTPMQSLTLAVLHRLFGTHPEGYFRIAYATMALCALLIALTVRKVTHNNLAALAAAVAWLVFPLRGQALFSINAGTGKWQGSVFISLAILSYLISFSRVNRKAWVFGSAMFYVLALLCYEQAVMIAPVFIVLEWFWSGRPLPYRLFKGWFWLHFVLTIGYVCIRTIALDAANAKAYHIDKAFLTTPLEWLRSLPQSIDVIWYLQAYRRGLSSFSFANFYTVNSILFFVSVLIAASVVIRTGIRRDSAEACPRSLRNMHRCGFALAGLLVFVAPQAFLLMLSATPEERMLVFPSIGFAFLVGITVDIIHSAMGLIGRKRVARLGEIGLILLLAVIGGTLASASIRDAEPYAEAGRITRTVHEQLESAAGTINEDQQVVILGTPWLIQNRAIVFTANYAISGCTRSALRRPIFPEQAHGAMTLVPESAGYDTPIPHCLSEMTASVHNLYTVHDRTEPNSSLSDYANLALFVFDGHRLKRVNRLRFQDLAGEWHLKTLANVADGIAYQFPRVAKTVKSPEHHASARPVQLRLPYLELVSFAVGPEAELTDTYHVQLVWKRLQDLPPKRTFLHALFLDASGEKLWGYTFSFDPLELSRQLEGHEWSAEDFLQQDLFVNETSGASASDWKDRVKAMKFTLQTTNLDGSVSELQVEKILPLKCETMFTLGEGN